MVGPRPVPACLFLRKKRVHLVGRCRLLKRSSWLGPGDIGWRRMPVTLSRRFLTSVVIKNSLATSTPAAREKIEIDESVHSRVLQHGINRAIDIVSRFRSTLSPCFSIYFSNFFLPFSFTICFIYIYVFYHLVLLSHFSFFILCNSVTYSWDESLDEQYKSHVTHTVENAYRRARCHSIR